MLQLTARLFPSWVDLLLQVLVTEWIHIIHSSIFVAVTDTACSSNLHSESLHQVVVEETLLEVDISSVSLMLESISVVSVSIMESFINMTDEIKESVILESVP